MKTANDVVQGTITDISNGVITIQAKYDDWFTLLKRGYQKCNIQLIDSRQLSDKQRRTCYALLRCISDYSGQGIEQTKDVLKINFLAEVFGETAGRIFSLSNAPMSLVCEFQRYLIRFILEWDIPCSFPLLEFADDTADYIYSCLINRKCVICGQHADLHHIDRVGIGRDRHDICHEGMEVLPLCRSHHGEIHTTGDKTFMEKFHIERGVNLDKTLCKIYRLKRRKDNE